MTCHSSVWVVSDTHFGHAKMTEYCGRPQDFEKRIFDGLDGLLHENDILIHLGDFCIGRDEYWHNIFTEIVPCKRWLVIGNHDKKSLSWYTRHGWDFVGKEIRMSVFGQNVLLTHEPKKRLENDEVNVHGHLHNNTYSDNVNHVRVSMEMLEYKPILLRTLLGE